MFCRAKAEREEDSGRARDLFDAWQLTDDSMLSLGSEVVSQIFLSALTNFTDGGRYVDKRRAEAERLSHMPLTLLSKLGPREDARPEGLSSAMQAGDKKEKARLDLQLREQRSNVLDFTIQNSKGSTAFNLSTEYKDTYASLQGISAAIDCSRPLYKNVLPDWVERLQYRTLPLRYLQGVIGFYFDLGTDVAVALTYLNSERYGEPYFWACVIILIFHIMMQCLFDWFTSMKGKRAIDRDWKRFQQKLLLNIFHVRILKEAWTGFSNWRADSRKATPRTIPASFDQVKLIEGLFEGLPQAILQTYLAVQDINRGAARDITPVRIVSLVLSYVSFATAIGSMGMRIQPVWRAAFILYVLTQVLMRSLTLTYFVFRVVQTTETVFSFNTVPGIALWMYLAFSWWMTVLFDFVNHKKGTGRSNLVPTWSGLFSCVFAFMVPVNLQEFTVLKTALPRAAPLPFFIFRQIEMLVIGSWFVHEVYCESAVMEGMLSERDLIGFWGDCSVQTMQQVCTIEFSTDADSAWATTFSESPELMYGTVDDYKTKINSFCSCGLDEADETFTERECSAEDVETERVFLENEYDAAVVAAEEEGGVPPQRPLGLGGIPGQGALDKERNGGKVSLLMTFSMMFTTLNYLLVAVLPYDKSDRLHSGLRALVWNNKGLIGCLRCFPCWRHMGEGSGDVEADEEHAKAGGSCCGCCGDKKAKDRKSARASTTDGAGNAGAVKAGYSVYAGSGGASVVKGGLAGGGNGAGGAAGRGGSVAGGGATPVVRRMASAGAVRQTGAGGVI